MDTTKQLEFVMLHVLHLSKGLTKKKVVTVACAIRYLSGDRGSKVLWSIAFLNNKGKLERSRKIAAAEM